ncbi:MAG: transglycosylase SLT domain-containing protein [Candidatus Thiodiazotropha sp. (ex Monitilora ramsayi)]|nr:transglycosylase SLT domain-containing protein [Candidatus Thiodiazotropha sp. (ex Monitilora ramsayi)]
MKIRYPFLLLALLVNLSLSPQALSTGNTHGTLDFTQQRAQFVAAEEALAANDSEEFQSLKASLSDYPLFPYLVYQETLHSLKNQTSANIRQALKLLQDTPLQKQLLDHWLALLAEERLWLSYLHFYQPGGSISRQCQHLQALINTGKRELAFESVTPIWLSGHSRPKACDPVLNTWIAAGHLDQSLVWQRFQLAMKAGQIRLARYVKRFLNADDVQWADRWLTLHADPSRWTQLIDMDHPMLDEMAVQTVRRLAWTNIDKAFNAWQRLTRTIDFSDFQHLQVARSLMGQISRQDTNLKSQQITGLLPKKYLHLDSTLSDKQIQFALQNNDWESLLLTLDGIPMQEQNSNRWRYWRARALINLGQNSEGEAILKTLSSDRSYYGFLAAQRLGYSPNLEHEKLEVDAALVEQLERLPGLQRARELHLLGRSLQARREWNLALGEKNNPQLSAAVRLAEKWHWPSQVIITLARLRQWNDLELRFPLAHQEAITTLAHGHGIDKAWVYAILRQESAFMTDAKSSVGARGLMQLMPKTAKAVASELSESIQFPEDLYLPEVNIKLGTSYLNKIYRQLQENPVLATAAYNAGPWRVQRWLPEKTQAADIWIETVPFRETREYLKRVLAYTVIYNYRLGLDPSQYSSSWLQPIEGQKAESGSVDTAISGV